MSESPLCRKCDRPKRPRTVSKSWARGRVSICKNCEMIFVADGFTALQTSPAEEGDAAESVTDKCPKCSHSLEKVKTLVPADSNGEVIEVSFCTVCEVVYVADTVTSKPEDVTSH